MPSRIIREGILTSERVEQLDAPAEVFYRRLMSKVDDHGLYDARPAILRSSLYPLRVDRVREADITRWIAACEKAGVIALYQHAGKLYLQMLDTRWQTRSEAKYPLPDADGSTPVNTCLQPGSTVPVFVGVVGVEDVGGLAGKPATRTPQKKAKKAPIPDDFAISERVRKWAQEKGFERIDEHLDAFVRKCKAKGYAYESWDDAFMEAIREDWAKLRGRATGGAAPASEGSTTTGSDADKATQAYLAAQAAEAAQRTAPPANLRDIRNAIVVKKGIAA